LAQYTNSYGYSFDNPVAFDREPVFLGRPEPAVAAADDAEEARLHRYRLGPMSTAQMRAIIEVPRRRKPARLRPRLRRRAAVIKPARHAGATRSSQRRGTSRLLMSPAWSTTRHSSRHW
jgi:hypothetical protein